MKTIWWLIGILAALVLLFYAFNSYIYNEKQGDSAMRTGTPSVQVIPLEHATAVVRFDEAVIYTDPTGGADAFAGQPAPAIVLVTDLHGDHLSTSTIEAVLGNATLIVPQAVADLLPDTLSSRAVVMGNGQMRTEQDFEITAVPMYNLPDSENRDRHTKGRGNGYVVERDGFRLYIAGDTAGTPEFRSMSDIDLALVPMNLPFTMGVEEAADAVIEMKPAEVIPYHYRGPDGLADIGRFKELVNAGDSSITVTLLDWYPGT